MIMLTITTTQHKSTQQSQHQQQQQQQQQNHRRSLTNSLVAKLLYSKTGEKALSTWKDGKCKPFERAVAVAGAVTENGETEGFASPKRAARATATLDEDNVSGDDDIYGRIVESDLTAQVGGDATVFGSRSTTRPTLDDYSGKFFSDYVDACDPASGIEEEYHPGSDGTFSWRGLRLLGRGRGVRFFEGFVETGLEGVVRRVWERERGVRELILLISQTSGMHENNSNINKTI